MGSIKVLVVDDSIFFREVLSRALAKDPKITVVGTASDPFEARDRILELHPDVLTLDVEMPKMNGIEFLRRLLPQYPIPVVVISSLAGAAFDALEAGAVDFVAKPAKAGINDDYIRELIEKIKVASGVHVKQRDLSNMRAVAQTAYGNRAEMKTGIQSQTGLLNRFKGKIIAIGASTGGTEAILSVLTGLPEGIPGVVVVQHMPEVFTAVYADRLNRQCAFEVREARNNDRVEPGLALIAPGGDRQMKVVKDMKGFFVRLVEMDKVSGHRPSVDYLFDSVAEVAGADAIGVILTGMGADGAKGMFKMREKGAYTIGQDETSCIVYGMPMVAFNMGAVMKQLPLDSIAREIMNRLKRDV